MAEVTPRLWTKHFAGNRLRSARTHAALSVLLALCSKPAMALITQADVVEVAIAVGGMDQAERLQLADEIFARHLLASVLVLQRMGASRRQMEVPLHILLSPRQPSLGQAIDYSAATAKKTRTALDPAAQGYRKLTRARPRLCHLIDRWRVGEQWGCHLLMCGARAAVPHGVSPGP